MAVILKGNKCFIDFRAHGKRIIRSLHTEDKSQAKVMEAKLYRAFKTGDFSDLDPDCRRVAVAIHISAEWQVPEALGDHRPKQAFTFWMAAENFLKYPEIANSKTKTRYMYCLVNLVSFFGENYPLNAIQIKDLRSYRLKRQEEGRCAATINWDMSTLSKLFNVMIEQDLIDQNPVKQLKRLSTKGHERSGYISLEEVRKIIDVVPEWFGRIIWTAYYTGMRRGEIIGLRRNQIDLHRRMIYLGPEDTKEMRKKVVPIHRDLAPIIMDALRIQSLSSDLIFLVPGTDGLKPISKDTAKNPWPRACRKLGLPSPHPRFHDLRHTWKTNARLSKMDWEIRESILGHWFKQKSVIEGYGKIFERELIVAIDCMTFEHDETKTESEQDPRKQNGNFLETFTGERKNDPAATGSNALI